MAKKRRVQHEPEAGHSQNQAVDPATLPKAVLAQAKPSIPQPSQAKNSEADQATLECVQKDVQEVKSGVQNLVGKVEGLQHELSEAHLQQELAAPTSAASGEQVIARGAKPDDRVLEDIVPGIKDLAHRAGGLDKLAEIVERLRWTAEDTVGDVLGQKGPGNSQRPVASDTSGMLPNWLSESIGDRHDPQEIAKAVAQTQEFISLLQEAINEADHLMQGQRSKRGRQGGYPSYNHEVARAVVTRLANLYPEVYLSKA
jgi:hypothetical protein